MTIKLFNSISKTIENFEPINKGTVKMYVCGPTVYDRPHIGNARSMVVYDVLYRLLKKTFGKDNVTYVRNITDVDDKINKAAKERQISIQKLTSDVIKDFEKDIEAVNCLKPNIEPKATEHIDSIIYMIKKLIEHKSAYISDNHVYFRVKSFLDYGKLARKNIDELESGSRVSVNENKEHPTDFVLWKPVNTSDDPSSVFNSPWGKGRPGWHIECSAMSTKYLGHDFDIHGGGVDLIFPHHTNEIAQSCSCFKGSSYAKYWVHNGFLTVENEKMSKSLGNFFTIDDLIKKGIPGEVIRYVYLSTHYRKPLNWSEKAVSDARKSLDTFYRILQNEKNSNALPDQDAIYALEDDMNTPVVLSRMHELAKNYNKQTNEETKKAIAASLLQTGRLLGLFYNSTKEWFHSEHDSEIENLITKRKEAKESKNWAEADRIREILSEKDIVLEDGPNGTTWRKK